MRPAARICSLTALSCAFLGACRSSAPAPDTAGLTRRVESLVTRDGATFGVVFADLSSGARVEVKPRRVMHAASTMKTAILLELLHEVDEGRRSLSDEIPVANEFRSAVDGSPFTLGLDLDSDKGVIPLVGGKAAIGLLAREMIVRSSNLAANILLTLVGPGSVQRFTDALGAPSVKVRRCVEDTKAFEKGWNNETDAAGMAALMRAVVESPLLSERSRRTAWEILAAQAYHDMIPGGLPEDSGAVVAHKTGSISSVEHDAALVRLPNGRTYVLVILTTDFGANDEGRARVKKTAREISRAVWEFETSR